MLHVIEHVPHHSRPEMPTSKSSCHLTSTSFTFECNSINGCTSKPTPFGSGRRVPRSQSCSSRFHHFQSWSLTNPRPIWRICPSITDLIVSGSAAIYGGDCFPHGILDAPRAVRARQIAAHPGNLYTKQNYLKSTAEGSLLHPQRLELTRTSAS